MKNASRNKFFLCFRPDVVLESKGGARVVGRSVSDRNLRYNVTVVENKEDVKVSASKSSLSDSGRLENSERSIHYAPKRTFSKAIKAVVFETILAKKVRDKKIGQGSDDQLVPQTSVDTNIQEIKTNSALLSSPSLSKSLSDSKKQNQETQQESRMKPKKMEMGFSSIYLLLISLTITIFWGRLCAILFTSIWLYFLPHGHGGGERTVAEKGRRAAETESKEYKKRVIMEGLLRRKSTQRALNL